MKWMVNESRDPFYNLALEEYLLTQKKDDYFMLWQNSPVVVVGKHQTTQQEVHTGFIEDQGINIVRRISGGGAVYHDYGNLNFSFIMTGHDMQAVDFRTYTQPVINVLGKQNLCVELSGRNDLTMDHKKISGNSQRLYKNRLMHHGTLLFDSNLSMLERVLNVDTKKFSSKGFQSIRSRVTNIKSYVEAEYTLELFKRELIEEVFNKRVSELEPVELSALEIETINALANEKYRKWEWNFGTSPKFNYRNASKLSCGTVEVSLLIDEGVIQEINFNGDFIGLMEPTAIERTLTHVKYDLLTIRKILSSIDLKPYFGEATFEELLAIIFDLG